MSSLAIRFSSDRDVVHQSSPKPSAGPADLGGLKTSDFPKYLNEYPPQPKSGLKPNMKSIFRYFTN